MSRTTFFISLLTFLLLQSACGSDSKKPEESIEVNETQISDRELIYQEVMKIHDAVMPKMSEINRIKRKLRDQMENDASLSDSEKTSVNITIEELAEAEAGMMDWMQAFRAPKKDDPDQKVIDYLNSEKVSISQVSDQMLKSIKKGTDLLNQLEKSQKENSNK